MPDPGDKGSFSAEIGQDVIEEALRAVQRRGGAEAPPAEGEEIPIEGAAAPAPEQAAAEDSELESLRSQLELSQAKGREMMEKLRTTHEQMLRATADLDNYRRRALKEKEEVQRFGIERLLKDFLPVVDNLDRALEHARGPEEFPSLLQGLKMTRKLFEDALGRHGVKGFSAVGQPFDPRLHEAMQQTESAEVPANHVVAEAARGYLLNERLIRPAMVMVSKGPPPESEGGGAVTEEAPSQEPGDGSESS